MTNPTPQSESLTHLEFQQHRGRLPDLIEEAIGIYDDFMKDDDYRTQVCLDRVVEKLKTARDFYDITRPAPIDARIEPRGCPTPGACSCVGANTNAPIDAEERAREMAILQYYRVRRRVGARSDGSMIMPEWDDALPENREKAIDDMRAIIAALTRQATPSAVDVDPARKAIARALEIAREVRDGFLSEEYATGQPVSSFQERFACDQVARAIEDEFAIGTTEQRRLLGKPPLSAQLRTSGEG